MTSSDDIAYADPERRLRRLLRRLPSRMQAITRWLRKPASRWARIPAGILLIIGGCLAILPVFGLWMLPLGLMLLADDIPPLRRFRDRALDWLERRRPNWFAAAGRATGPRRRAADAALPSPSGEGSEPDRTPFASPEEVEDEATADCDGSNSLQKIRNRVYSLLHDQSLRLRNPRSMSARRGASRLSGRKRMRKNLCEKSLVTH